MLYVIFIAIGLAMDSFSASVVLGSVERKKSYVNAIFSSGLFGFFQAIMPLIGWVIGGIFKSYISGLDHWAAFFLLFIIGLKMIKEGISYKDSSKNNVNIIIKTRLYLAFATSIDALIVGMGINLINAPIFLTIIIIGLVTFLLSLTGFYLGGKSSSLLKNNAGIFGGSVLILIGLKILVDHLII